MGMGSSSQEHHNDGSHPGHVEPATKKEAAALLLGVLGIVYGDIGTSPLYALKECFLGSHPAPMTPENILGILSMFFWSIVLIVAFKYVTILLRADNNGEGGIMAVLALLTPKSGRMNRKQKQIILLGLFGAALLYGDGAITPAISVMSAVEGLKLATPALEHAILPISVVILLLLFFAQKRGTARMGAIFGPAMLIWFLTLASIGLPWIIREPMILSALSPHYALAYFFEHGFNGFLVLSAVVLCITGAEALYADMGHFGPKPIRRAWYGLVMPALMINYFGQGAFLLTKIGQPVESPFFEMVPTSMLYPMVLIATLATVIASQALISGVYSLTQQAMQLGYLPRFSVVHTSEQHEGQIYIPRMNQFLLVGCLTLVLTFRTSSNLAGAYGIAVISTMVINSILLHSVARDLWKWSKFKAGSLVALFLMIECAFLGANLAKVVHGGWVSLAIGIVIFTLMTTWRRGRKILSKETFNKSMPIEQFLKHVQETRPHRVKGMAVFMTPNKGIAPSVLLHHLKHSQVLHEKVVVLTITTKHVPHLPYYEHGRVTELGNGLFQVVAAYGYMQRPNVYEILKACENQGLAHDPEQLSFFLGRETLLTTGPSSMAVWRKKLFGFMSRNAQPATVFFGIPPDRVVEVGLQLEV